MGRSLTSFRVPSCEVRRRHRSDLRLWRLACAFVLAVLSFDSTAKAASFQLTWDAPQGCPSREAIVAATLARLKRPIGEGREFFVYGTVSALEPEFVVALTLKDDRGRELGEREVRVAGRTCADIEEPSSLVLAMMIAVALPHERSADAAEPPAEAAEPPAQLRAPAAPQQPPARVPAHSAALAPPRTRHVAMSGAAVGAFGSLPGMGYGLALRGLYSSGALAGAVEAGVLDSGAVPAGSEAMGFRLLELSARAGVVALRSGSVELVPHVALRGGVLRLTPIGFSLVQSTARGVGSVGAGMLARLRVAPHVLVEVLPELQAVLVRDQIQVVDAGKLYHVHRAAPVEGRLSIGLSYEFR